MFAVQSRKVGAATLRTAKYKAQVIPMQKPLVVAIRNPLAAGKSCGKSVCEDEREANCRPPSTSADSANTKSPAAGIENPPDAVAGKLRWSKCLYALK